MTTHYGGSIEKSIWTICQEKFAGGVQIAGQAVALSGWDFYLYRRGSIAKFERMNALWDKPMGTPGRFKNDRESTWATIQSREQTKIFFGGILGFRLKSNKAVWESA